MFKHSLWVSNSGGSSSDDCDGLGEACDNDEIESDSSMKECMASCNPPTNPAGPFDCDGMKCFVKCSSNVRFFSKKKKKKKKKKSQKSKKIKIKIKIKSTYNLK